MDKDENVAGSHSEEELLEGIETEEDTHERSEEEETEQSLNASHDVEPERERKDKQKMSKRKKDLLVYLCLGLVFFCVIWFAVLKPSSKDGEGESGDGLNVQLPQSSDSEIIDDKIVAYEMADGTTASEDYWSSLERQDTTTTTELIVEDPESDPVAMSPTSYYEEDDGYGYGYQAPAYDTYYSDQLYQAEEEVYNLQAENDQLRSDLEDVKEILSQVQADASRVPTTDEKIEEYRRKKEVDYELERRRAGDNKAVDPSETHPDVETLEVVPSITSVVSVLEAPVPDSVLIERYSKERNLGFYSLGRDDEVQIPRNAVRAVADRTVVLKEGDYLPMRLLEEAHVGGVTLPRGMRLMGVARLSDGRMKIIVSSAEYQGRIFTTSLTAFDMDGQEGINAPVSSETEALREAAGAVARAPMSMGVSINNSGGAGQQVIADAARSLMTAGASYLSKKVSDVKVTVKAGHQLYLVASK